MLCLTCKTHYYGLACSDCTARKSQAAFMELQRRLVPLAIRSGALWRVARKKRSDPYHVELLQENTHAFCGAPLEAPMMRTVIDLTKATKATLCPACVKVLEGLMPTEDELPDTLPEPEGIEAR